MPAKVLVVDDDPAVLKLLKRYLSANGFGVIVTDNGSEALLLVRESRPDVIICDAEMPGLDGYAVCRVLKKDEKTAGIPMLMVSGTRLQEGDILEGFLGGADDYIGKPFSLPVLLARVKAVLRRGRPGAGTTDGDRIKERGLELDLAGRTVRADGKPVGLTRKEFDLLEALVSKAGRLLSVSYLLETVWGYDPAVYNDPATVEVHVSHLRGKLGPKLGKRIVTVTGHGYKFEK
ncbi:MAG: response regulator transcription factor [Elusimicrobia bacterium]|nr:response regulator transcription factor [Elusimicrobiota bacterium]